MFRYTRLNVWNKGVEFADCVHAATRTLLDDERFGLTSQMREASISVSSNVAEGSGRSSDKDFAHFTEIVHVWLVEAVSQTQVALRQSFFRPETRVYLYQRGEEMARTLSGLKTSLPCVVAVQRSPFGSGL